MKKFIILLSCLLFGLAGYTQELKGIRLGSYTNISEKKPKITTLCNRDYALSTVNMKNGKCCAVIGVPVTPGEGLRNINYAELEMLLDALRDKYPGEMEYKPKPEDPDNRQVGYFFITSDTYEVMVVVDDYNAYSKEYVIMLRLADLELFNQYYSDKQKDL